MPAARSFLWRNASAPRYRSQQYAWRNAYTPRSFPRRNDDATPSAVKLDLRDFNGDEFSIYATDFPQNVITREDIISDGRPMNNTAVLQLGEHDVAFLNWDVEYLFQLPTQSVDKDLRNLSAILPYVRDMEEQKEIEARLGELKEWAKQKKRPRFVSAASTVELSLRGYVCERNIFVDFRICKKDFPRSVIATYLCGERKEECEGVQVGGYLLAFLQGGIDKGALDTEISNLTTIIPSVRSLDENRKIKRRLKQLKAFRQSLLKKKGSLLPPSYTMATGPTTIGATGFAEWTDRTVEDLAKHRPDLWELITSLRLPCSELNPVAAEFSPI